VDGLPRMWYLRVREQPDREDHMAWDETTQEKYRRNAERYESDLTDGEWAVIEPLIPPPSRLGRRRTTDLREVLNAIRYMLATGCQWRAIPKCFPPFTTIQDYFYPWRDNGVFERMLDALRGLARDLAGRSPEPTAAGIDSQSVRTVETAGPSGYDAGKKVKGRKRHIAVDVEGTPIVVQVHTADIQDRDGAPDVILDMLEKAPEVRRVWADSGYSGERLRETLAGMGVPDALEIVRRPNGIRGFTVLYRRWVVERTFAWMSRCRRLAKDFERSLESSVAWARPGACRFPGRRLARGADG